MTAPAERRGNSGRAFRVVLAAFVLVGVSKVHEAIPKIGIVPWVKVAGVLLMLNAGSVLRPAAFKAMLRTSTARWVLVIIALALIGAPFALWKGEAVRFIFNVFWKPVLLLLVAGPTFTDYKTMRTAIIAFVVGSGIAALRVAVGLATFAREGDIERAALGGTFDPNETALLFLVAVPFALQLANERTRDRAKWYLLALVLVAGTVRTGSRAGFLGLLAVGAWWLRNQLKGKAKFRTVMLAGGAAAVFALTATSQLRSRFSTVLTITQDYNFTSRDGRIEVWKRGIRYMLTHPVLGVGIANFPIAEGDISGKENQGFGIKYSEAHNSFIQVGGELGILGLIAFIGVFWTAYRGCTRLRRDTSGAFPPHLVRVATATEGALLAFLVTGSFLSFAYQMVTFFLIALAVGIRMASDTVVPGGPAIAAEPARTRYRSSVYRGVGPDHGQRIHPDWSDAGASLFRGPRPQE
jgi:O-antigen ligase